MSHSKPENPRLTPSASLVAALLCVSFGANAVAIKICLEGIGSFTLAATRFIIAAGVISLWARTTGRTFRLKKGQFTQILILSAFFMAQTGFFYLGIDRTNASRSTLLSNLQPFLVLLMAHFLIPNERVTLRKMVGIAMGFGGALIMVAQKQGVTDQIREGDLLVLAAVIFWAFSAIYIKRIISEFEPFQITMYPMIVMFPVFIVAGYFMDEAMFFKMTPDILAALAYQSILTASLGFVVWNTLQKRHGIVATHSYIFLIPVSGVVFGGLILGEPVGSINVIAALMLIVLGIVLVNTGNSSTRNEIAGRN